jgi:hypothetical protein
MTQESEFDSICDWQFWLGTPDTSFEDINFDNLNNSPNDSVVGYLPNFLNDDFPHPKQIPSYPGELEDRCIEILNFDIAQTTESVVRNVCETPDLDRIDMSERTKGRIFVHYFNLQSALQIRGRIVTVSGRQWILRFRLPQQIFDRKHPPNNGTIVLFNLPLSVTNESLRQKFEPFGEIRDVRSEKKKGFARFIEFWDKRDCERAYRSIQSGKLFEKPIIAEFSRPGGYRKFPEKFAKTRVPTVVRRKEATLTFN